MILWNGMDLNLRRRECKVLVIYEIPRDGIREWFAKITHICLHQICLFLVLYCDNHVWSEQWFNCVSMLLNQMVCWCYSHHASIAHPIYRYSYGFTHTRVVYRTYVFPHMCGPAPCARERSIYTLRQLVNLASSSKVFCLPRFTLLIFYDYGIQQF